MGNQITVLPKESHLTPIDGEFVKKVLRPYREHTTYLKEIFFGKKSGEGEEGWIAKAEFAIGESCYIDDTGHFNAVEYNICYNQLTYVYLAHCIENGLIPELEGFAGGGFFEKQLSHFLIVNFSSSFKSQINAKRFYGDYGINSIIKKSKCTFISTYCNFHDDDKGRSTGEVTLAILHP